MAPQVSPDGTRIAFEVHQAERDKDRRISHIWMVAAGEQPVQLTRGENGDSSARWSPDGRRLAFISARGAADAKPLVWLLELDGGEARRVTQAEGGVTDFNWSPERCPHRLRLGGHSQTRAGSAGWGKADSGAPAALQSRGAGILGECRTHLFVIPLESGDAVQLRSGDYFVGAHAWRPKGAGSPAGRAAVARHARMSAWL